jgi:hypothetical protein
MAVTFRLTGTSSDGNISHENIKLCVYNSGCVFLYSLSRGFWWISFFDEHFAKFVNINTTKS